MLRFEKILCPTDFSEPSSQALIKASAFARDSKAELLLMHVLPRETGGVNEVEVTQMHRNLAHFGRDYIHPSIPVRTVVHQGNVVSEILQAARDAKVDLIIMATHGATGWRELDTGSVADKIVRLAPCPVFAISSLAARNKEREEAVDGLADEQTEGQQAMGEETFDVNAFHGRVTVEAAEAIACGENAGSASPSGEERDFPYSGSVESQLRFLLRYAVQAPSNRNTQPWLWHINGGSAELYADTSRSLQHLDPENRELILSCGASLAHLRIAIRHFGFEPEVEVLPDNRQPNFLARVRLSQGDGANLTGMKPFLEDSSGACPTSEDLFSDALTNGDLFDAIALRHTNRHPFHECELPARLKQLLQQEALSENVDLQFIEKTDERMALINLIVKGDRIQEHDPDFLQESNRWIRPDRRSPGDGIPQQALGGKEALGGRSMQATMVQGDKDRLLAWSAPAIAVLQTPLDSPGYWMATGQALARVLLRAALAGVQASFFNSPVEVVSMWPQLFQVLHCSGLPQIILRLGYPIYEAEQTPRRALSEVVIQSAPQ